MKVLKFKYQFKDIPGKPFLDLDIYDDSITEEDVKNEVLSIIKENREAVTFIDYDIFYRDNKIYLDELDYSKQPDEIKKLIKPEHQQLSTLAVSKLIKEKHPDWFENPIESLYFKDEFSLCDIWNNTML